MTSSPPTRGWIWAASVVGTAVLAAAVALNGSAWADQSPTPVLGTADLPVVDDSYIVILRPGAVPQSGVAAQADRLAARYGGAVRRSWQNALLGFEVSMSADRARRLAAEPMVAYVEPNQRISVAETQSDPPSFGLDRIDQRDRSLDGAFTFPNTAANVHVYVIDTGIRTSHRDFDGRAESGFDAVDGGQANDCSGHGTHVAGTVAGNSFGVAKEATLVAVRVADCDGVGSTGEVIAGVNFVTKNAVKPAVVNMSLGGGRSAALRAAVTNSIASGITYVIAAGNADRDACDSTLSSIDTAIVVGATDRRDRRASFSNFGDCVDIFAPGVKIASAFGGSDRAARELSGTSMAAPHVAGAAALVLGGNPQFSPAQVKDFLAENATGDVVAAAGDRSPNRLLFVGQ